MENEPILTTPHENSLDLANSQAWASLLRERDLLKETVDQLERHILDLELADRKGW